MKQSPLYLPRETRGRMRRFFNKQTHNYEGLIEELERQKVTSLKEKNAILRLTDFGRLGGKIWKIIYDINNSPQMKARIVMPGKYILKLLQN